MTEPLCKENKFYDHVCQVILLKKTTQATRDDNTSLHTINNVKLHMFSCIRS